MTTAAVEAFSTDPALRHAPGSPEVVKGGFQCACRCGYPGRVVSSSPSHAYNATQVHANNENRREKQGGRIVESEDYTRNGEPPKGARPPRTVQLPPVDGALVGSSRPATVPRSRSGGTPGTPCGCGCGEPSGGLFRPGHDSKLLSRLMKSVREEGMTVADALAEMTTIGASDKLKAKFESKVSA